MNKIKLYLCVFISLFLMVSPVTIYAAQENDSTSEQSDPSQSSETPVQSGPSESDETPVQSGPSQSNETPAQSSSQNSEISSEALTTQHPEIPVQETPSESPEPAVDATSPEHNASSVSASEFTVESMTATCYAASSSGLNVRSGPSTDYTVLGTLSYGEKIEVTGKTDNNWYQLSYKGKTGYISAKYTSNEPLSESQKPAESDTSQSTSADEEKADQTPSFFGTPAILILLIAIIAVIILIIISVRGFFVTDSEDDINDNASDRFSSDGEYEEEEYDDSYDEEEYEDSVDEYYEEEYDESDDKE